jgi:hypothetical protein
MGGAGDVEDADYGGANSNREDSMWKAQL